MQTPALVQVRRDRVVLQSTETHLRLRIIIETMFRYSINHRGTSQTPGTGMGVSTS